MSDLIYRQAAIDALCDNCDNVQAVCAHYPCKQYIAVEKLQSVDAVEVVRCKDCKHFHYDMPYVIQGIPVLGHEVCDFWGDGCKTNENGFCSYAERRTDGQT